MNHKEFLDIPAAGDEEIRASQLKLGYWIAGHRVFLRTTGIALFIVFDAALGIYNIYKWSSYFLSGYFADQRNVVALVRSSGEFNTIVAARAARPLAIEGTVAYESSKNHFDAVALVQNPNADWYAEFEYTFDVGVGVTQKLTGFVMPGDEKPIGAFNIEGAHGLSEPLFKISNLRWRHISKHEIPDIFSYLGERKRFEVADARIISAAELGLPEGRLSFDLHNQSFFDFRDPEFFVGVWHGNTLLRVYKIHVPQLNAGEARNIELAVPSNMPAGAVIKLYPDINFFDLTVYSK